MTKLDVPELQLLRDKAILLIGFMGAFRRSEIAAITVEHLQFSPQGVEIFVPSLKSRPRRSRCCCSDSSSIRFSSRRGYVLYSNGYVPLVLLKDLYI